MANFKLIIPLVFLILAAACSEDEEPAVAPYADFTGTQDGRTFTFVNLSTNATSYLWDFGDGIGTSTEVDPIYTYAPTDDEFKDYVVTLTATGPGGSNKVAYIVSISGRVTASFKYSPSAPKVDEYIDFTDMSINGSSYFWEFGDGNTSTSRNPVHYYTSVGNFSVKLTVEGMEGTEGPDDTTMVITVIAPEVTAEFNVSDTVTQVNDVLFFYNNSNYGESYMWDFGDGTTSTDSDPLHTYTDTGNFVVTLKVSGYGIEKEKSISIEVNPPVPTAQFSISSEQIVIGDKVTFTSTGEWAEGYTWNFGDGNVYTEKEVEYSFTSAGFYEVSLTVTNESGSNTVTNNYVEVIIDPSIEIFLTGIVINDMPFQLADLSFYGLPETGVNFTDGTMDFFVYMGEADYFYEKLLDADEVNDLYTFRSDFLKTAKDSEDFPQSISSFYDITDGSSLNLDVKLSNEDWRFDTWETGVDGYFNEIHHAGEKDGNLNMINPYRNFDEVDILGFGEYTTTYNINHNNNTGTSITFKYKHKK